jgi:hypothetical protein
MIARFQKMTASFPKTITKNRTKPQKNPPETVKKTQKPLENRKKSRKSLKRPVKNLLDSARFRKMTS